MEYPSYQPYSENLSYESCPPTYQPDYSNHHPSYTNFYPDQTCPDQPHHQPQLQQSCELASEENHNANSAAGRSEGVTAFQHNVRSCTKSEAEAIIEMLHTYEEQQSYMESMIRQVTLLAEMIKEVKENRARSEVNGSAEVKEGVKRVEEKEPNEAEKKSEAPLEEKVTEEVEADEEKEQTEAKLMIPPPDIGTPKKIPEEACDESLLTKEAIECREKIDNTTLYLQLDKVHEPREKVEESTYMVKEESTLAEELPPVIDQSKGCSYEEEEPKWKEEERTRRKAARAIYWMQLPPWPEPERMGKLMHYFLAL